MCDKKRICIDLEAEVHKILKMTAVEKETTISELVKNQILKMLDISDNKE